MAAGVRNQVISRCINSVMCIDHTTTAHTASLYRSVFSIRHREYRTFIYWRMEATTQQKKKKKILTKEPSNTRFRFHTKRPEPCSCTLFLILFFFSPKKQQNASSGCVGFLFYVLWLNAVSAEEELWSANEPCALYHRCCPPNGHRRERGTETQTRWWRAKEKVK